MTDTIQLFRGADMGAAMAQVRQALGPDAMIVMTRRVGDEIEVTAALDPPEERAAVEHDLAWHGVPDALIQRLSGPLEPALAAALRWAPLDGSGAVLLVGPPGAGKTLTAARLATRMVLAGTTPTVITADDRRAGAAEQLAAFTRLLDLPLVVAGTPRLITRAIARGIAGDIAGGSVGSNAGAPVLIDTPGTDPWTDRALITDLAAAASARIVLVLPAGLDGQEAAELAEGYASLSAVAMIATRLDVTRRHGSVLWAAQHLALAEAGVGPGATDGLVPFTPLLLCSILRVPQLGPRLAKPGQAAHAMGMLDGVGDGGRRIPA